MTDEQRIQKEVLSWLKQQTSGAGKEVPALTRTDPQALKHNARIYQVVRSARSVTRTRSAGEEVPLLM